MAKKKQHTSTASTPLDSGRKMEIIGIIVLAIAVLLGLSIVSYTAEDYQYAQRLSFLDLFNPDASSRMIQNWLGPVGAYISHFLVYKLFGYTSLLFALIVGYNGWHTFRRRSFRDNAYLNVLSIWGMVLLSTFLGWLITNAGAPEDPIWSGGAGIAFASILQNITGIGSIFILSVLILITLLLFVERDLQKTIDSLKLWMEQMQEKMEQNRQERAERKAQRAAEREERIAEKRAELQLKKEEKEALKKLNYKRKPKRRKKKRPQKLRTISNQHHLSMKL